jgi:hypothetical protein
MNPDTRKQLLNTPGVNPDLPLQLANQPDMAGQFNTATKPNWVTGTVYAAGAIVKPTVGNANASYFRTAAGGTSGDTEPSPWSQTLGGVSDDSGMGAGISDWVNVGSLPYWL